MEREKIQNLISQMTLEEKAGMCSGADFWNLKGIERLGIPKVMVTDGPHGIRKQAEAADHLGINESEKAICFPAGCATASSFDRDLIRRQGELLGQECQAMNVSTILGPAMNIKRSPLCGRNFEYYSEDPYVSTEIAAALIEGVQSKNVGTSAKHFVANNQEKRRMTNSSDADERTLREIYLASFEGAIKKAKPWTVMSSYNRINGEFVGDNKEYLTDILRKEWGFDGYVVSDWGAVNDRISSLAAGLDLEMPPGDYENDRLIVKAVQEGKLDESVVDQACERILNIIFRYTENRDEKAVFDYEKDHKAAAEIEAECMVLLKNENEILPLTSDKKIAFIGKYAKTPRYQGGGSSHINSWKVESALEAAKEIQELANVTFAEGYQDEKDEVVEALQSEAVKAAAEADVAVLFLGLPDNFESEGYDRKHMNLPNCQNELVRKVLEVQKHVVVVLHNGSAVLMPWKDQVEGILEAYLGGEAVGKAVAEVLAGIKNPCGRLAETFPLRLEDTPCYLTYGKGFDNAVYQEGVFVGYRYYTSRKMETAFPFGYGLSYTTFAYSDLQLDKKEMSDKEHVEVSVKVKNTGKRAGKTVVQLYVAAPEAEVVRPVRELRGFEKIFLEAGEEKTVTFILGERALAYWNTLIHDWYAEEGTYKVMIGENADQMCVGEEITVHPTKELPKTYSLNTCLGELMRDPKAQTVMAPFMQGMAQNDAAMDMAEANENDQSGVVNQEMMAAMMEGMPLRQLLSFVPGIKREMLEQMVNALNQL
ncbi:glycosyl hydrolase [Firmicutes bacterium AM41-5BH]|uniref:Glycoside hydrolase family 3 C-terminal domain-containing protein n=1 Tax=Ruminococcus hominis TaxID=2763065 RepID=A0ABR7G5A0_9FIRM|nr:glycoside hydrolase family 3 C-terminal domain-containing protein [Ruminococcus hominis]MBC5682614.1 glycoside hydrolase family 3 C-terminal domain-containing protein [Ruminococcus hominis]RGH37925.1 glycosyl hydrolase [Firmicutes bacterium AM41-5BH]